MKFVSHFTERDPFNGLLSRTTQVSRYQKGKPIWILLKQETVSGSGISWATRKSAPRSRQITTPAHHISFLQARCPSCRPTNGVKALKVFSRLENISSLAHRVFERRWTQPTSVSLSLANTGSCSRQRTWYQCVSGCVGDVDNHTVDLQTTPTNNVRMTVQKHQLTPGKIMTTTIYQPNTSTESEKLTAVLLENAFAGHVLANTCTYARVDKQTRRQDKTKLYYQYQLSPIDPHDKILL